MTQGHDSTPTAHRPDRPGSGGVPTPDPVFAGLFADAPPPATGSPDPDAEDDEVQRGVLRPCRPVEESVLAGLAAESSLVTEALALARRVAEGSAQGPAHEQDSTEQQVLWSAAVEADLIRVDGSTVTVGDAVQVWQHPATPQARLDSWARLVAGLLRARAATNVGDDAVGGLGLASTPLYYTLARDPMPAALPALVLATSTDGDADEFDPAWMFAQLPASIDTIARDWVRAGVLLPVESPSAEDVDALDELFQALAGDLHDHGEPRALLLKPLVEAVQASPIVRLTALGDYGLRRMLLAHGWQVRLVGEAAGVPPDNLLDLLLAYPPEDSRAEAAIWLEARGDSWQRALRQVAASAQSKKPDVGPGRRAALGDLLRQVGPPVAGLLDLLATDPWLAAVVADVRHDLGLGPEPTLAEELWLIVDAISAALDGEAEERAEAVEDSNILEFLALPGALAAAATLSHPHTRYVLQLAVEVSGDRELAHQLRRTLDSGPIRPGKGRPKRQRRR